MKPHNQHAPGLGQLNDKLGAIAAQYRRYVDKELATTEPNSGGGKRKRDSAA